MDIVKVDEHNLTDLFEMNQVLASEEDQADLFTANLLQYKKAFLGESPVVGAYVCMFNNKSVGFYTYIYKFATYLGKPVFHIEDLYLEQGCREKYITVLLKHAVQKAGESGCCRVEMRVMKYYNMGYRFLDAAGFCKVSKWDVFRFSKAL